MPNRPGHEPGPIPFAQADHLLHPLRRLILSPPGLVRRLSLEPDSAVLELGPGPGYFSIEVARAIPKGKLVLVDVQQEMLDMARRRLEDRGLTNVEYLKGDAVSLPLADSSVDVAFLVAVLGEVLEPGAALHELHRVLRRGGTLSLTEQMIGDPHALSRADMLKMAQEAGFSNPKTRGRLATTVNLTA